MMNRFWLGAVCFVAGGAVWLLTRERRGEEDGRTVLPPMLPRFGLALAALGAAIMSSTQPELSWTISTICFAMVAIVLLVTVLVEQLRGSGPSSRR